MKSDRLNAIIELIDAANGLDPNHETSGGDGSTPSALLYGRRMSAALALLDQEPSEVLQIACRAQHLERWVLPRSDYPQTKAGYYAWRNEQKNRHANRVSEMMSATGYGEAARSRVASLVRKEGIKWDAEAQMLEDAACLVFLENYAVKFASGRDETQIVGILRKTWRKMSEHGQAKALELPLAPPLRAMIAKALECVD